MSDTDRQIRPFADWLAEQRGGVAASEASEALNELLEAVMEHGKAGDLTLVVHVKPAGTGAVFVVDEIRLKKPQPEKAAALYFVDDDHNLSRHDPRQQRLPLREVPPPPAADQAKEVPTGA